MIQTPSTVIDTVDELRDYLQIAIQLEHATIPPYLTAAYSANIAVNRPSIEIIRAVAREEMLHLTLAANLLNSVGGSPDLLAPDFIPKYPAPLPTGQDDFLVGVEKFSQRSLDAFLCIERPTSLKPEHEGFVQHVRKTVTLRGGHNDEFMESMRKDKNAMIPVTKAGNDYELHYDIAFVPHERLLQKRKAISEQGRSMVPHVMADTTGGGKTQLHFWSIGEFYKAIHLGFVELVSKLGSEQALFTGDRGRQVDTKYYFSAGGELNIVKDLQSALTAIDLIAAQGEGSNDRVYDSDGELAHYYRFDQIQRKRYYREQGPDGQGDQAGNPRGEEFEVDMNAVFPIRANARIADYAGHPELEENARLFNGRYKRFLEKLNAAFNGQPDLLGAEFQKDMWSLAVFMQRLIKNPIPGTDENAAPTFEMDQFTYPPTEVATHA